MSLRPLEERIRDLCAKAALADDSEIAQVLQELREALAEHTRRLRKMAAQKLTGRGEDEERRS